jgi:hypothetical protein
MSDLKQILQSGLERKHLGGGDVSTTVRRALRAHKQRQFAIFVVVFVLVILLVGFGVYQVGLNAGNHSRAAAYSTGLGISVAGLLEVLRRVWREWSQSDLVLILLEDASKEQVNTLLDRLVKKL